MKNPGLPLTIAVTTTSQGESKIMPHWTFRTRHGLWAIVPKDHGWWQPHLNGDSLGEYRSSESALNALCQGFTYAKGIGVDTSSVGLPPSLSDWIKHD